MSLIYKICFLIGTFFLVEGRLPQTASVVLEELKKEFNENALKDVYLCQQDHPSASGFRMIDVPIKIYNENQWDNAATQILYKQQTNLIFVGQPKWLKEMLAKAMKFTTSLNLHIFTTRILLIATEDTPDLVSLISSSDLTNELLVIVIQIQAKIYRGYTKQELSIFASRTIGSEENVFEMVGRCRAMMNLSLTSPLYKPLLTFAQRDLRMAVLNKPKVFEIYDSKGNSIDNFEDMSGYTKEIINIIGQKLEVTLKTVETKGFGNLVNGSWTGAIAVLVKGDCDMSPLDFTPSWSREQYVDMSAILDTDPVSLFSRAPSVNTPAFLLLQVFQPIIWFLIGLVVFSSGIVIYLIEKWSPARDKTKNLSASTSLAVTYQAFLFQNTAIPVSANSSKTFVSCMLLVSIIVCSVYKGYITVLLAIPQRNTPINTPEDLMQQLETTNIIPIGRANTIAYFVVKNFKSYKPIGDKIELLPASELSTKPFFDKVAAGEYILLDTFSSGKGNVAFFEDRLSECKIHTSERPLVNDLDVFMHRKNSIFKTRIDATTVRLFEAGIIAKMKKTYYSALCMGLVRKLDKSNFNLLQFQSAFYVLVLGVTASIVAFLAEMILPRNIIRKFFL